MTDEQVLMFADAISQMMAIDVFIGVTAGFLFQAVVTALLSKPRRDKELRSDDEAPSHSTD
ncbi:hypothetical protein LYZ37_19045 [Vibrio tubiashii]|uniref:hypothetical protein n=1 Tax=Vibrio tubiashii TaxID=29498 RepID=UPI00234F1BB9|nr:hypothetical protein [Vibrio tubiashii]WCP70101.1 hypothetical protein LYZ37_19045 [Vibrio tubiashii]